MSDDDIRIRPGRIRNRGSGKHRPKTLVALVRALTNKAGRTGAIARGRHGTGRRGRGRSAALRMRNQPARRRVIIKARVIRHSGARFQAAPLSRHISYLKRDGVTRDGKDAELFSGIESPDASAPDGIAQGATDISGFAERCAGDRHHFRFIVSPEDAGELADVRAFTRELMSDMQTDLGSKLDWIAVDHWNTDNPHIHILLRGRADDGSDLVIDRDYIREGMRSRAEERVTIELGRRTEREIEQAMAREVGADRFTSLDRRLQRIADAHSGIADLRSDPVRQQSALDRHLIGRATKLESLGLATRIMPGCWRLGPAIEPALRAIGVRGDIIKTMHRAMASAGIGPDPERLAVHDKLVSSPVIGQLLERGLHDELTGEAFAIVDGADGRVHHLRFASLEQSGDATAGAIVELRSWTDQSGRSGQSLFVHSDLALAGQIAAGGATWLDRQLVSSDRRSLGNGFGRDIDQALMDRAHELVRQGFATRHGERISFPSGLLAKLRAGELQTAADTIAAKTGLLYRPVKEGDAVSGTYRERLHLASGRFVMIDDGLGFELVPWRPQLDRHLGEHVKGTMKSGGGIEWSMGRSKGMAI